MSSKMKPKLSKGILEMKFMQRTKAKFDKEIDDAEGRAMYSNEITERMLNQSNSNFIIEPSYIHCEGLIEGRLSFRGMNPELERLLELEQAEREASQKHEQPAEVSANEMAAFYHAQQAPAASKAMQKKFQNKRKFNKNKDDGSSGKVVDNKKGKFQKPRNSEDEDEE